MRQIKYIFIHCTAGNPNATIADLKLTWKNRGWKEVGYHKIVHPDGKVTVLRNDEIITNGVQGYNSNAVHVSYTGGIDMKTLKAKDTRTKEQKEAIKKVVKEWKKLYPDAKILGHRQVLTKGVNWKDCPSFEVKEEDFK